MGFNQGSLGVSGGGGQAATAWLLLGNAGTVDGTNFIGTTDNVPLNFRVNNIASGRIDKTGRNTYFGYQSGLTETTSPGGAATDNCFFGYQSGMNTLAIIGNGNNNVAFGSQALKANTSDADNTAVGYASLLLSDGSGAGGSNTAFGYRSGAAITTGAFLTFVGHGADASLITAQYSIGLGYGATVTASNQFVIGSVNGIITSQRTWYNGTGPGLNHQEFYTQASPEGVITGTRGDIAYVNDGATGTAYIKATGTGNTGWSLLDAGVVSTLYSANGTISGTRVVNQNSVALSFTAGLSFNLTESAGVTLNPFGVAAGNTTELRFLELAAGGTNYTGFKAPDALAGNVIYVLPVADATVSGQVLSSDASGNLSWISAGGGGWGTTGTVATLTGNSTLSLAGNNFQIADGANTLFSIDLGTFQSSFKATNSTAYSKVDLIGTASANILLESTDGVTFFANIAINGATGKTVVTAANGFGINQTPTVNSPLAVAAVPAFANDAAAALGGLVSGETYQTTVAGITSVNIVP